MTKNLEEVKQELLAQIEKRVNDKIIEPTNAAILNKLINRAEDETEAISIATLGTTYKRTGFHFDKRLEKIDDTIKYFTKNEELSFQTSPDDITHKLIIGDNYQALQNLLIEYKNKIDVIYIDPPYGSDSMGEFAETNYNNAINRDNLLSMLYPRLVLARHLLSDKGVIFCSIDDRNQAYVKCLFDEIFEEKNFVGMWNWYKSETPPNLSKKIKKNIEYILAYEKCRDNVKYKGIQKESKSSDPFTKPQNTLKQLTFPANSIEFKKKNGVIKAGIYGTDKYPNKLLNDIIIENKRNSNAITFENKFVWEQKKLDNELTNKTKIYCSKDIVLSYKKAAYDEEVPPNLISGDVGVKTTEEAGKDLAKIFDEDIFDYPKSVSLIKYLCDFKRDAFDEKIVILDFFAGSGTTGQAVLELNKDGDNRQFILVQLNEDLDKELEKNPKNTTIKNQIDLCDKYNRPHYLSEITCERLRRVMTGKCYDGTNDFEWIKNNKPLGGNLDVYNIASVSNASNVKDKTPFDVIDETLYGEKKFTTIKEKIEWVINNFEHTQKNLDGEE